MKVPFEYLQDIIANILTYNTPFELYTPWLLLIVRIESLIPAIDDENTEAARPKTWRGIYIGKNSTVDIDGFPKSFNFMRYTYAPEYEC